MVFVSTIIGDEALVLATCLEAVVSSEGLPPDKNRDSRVGRTLSPTLGHLKCTLYVHTVL